MSFEAGDALNEQERPAAVVEKDAKFEVLTRLHARACLIALEVYALMRAGHASGAYSRWRTLHEIAVVSHLITKGDRDLAERYLLHEIIESHKAAEQQLLYQDDLGLDNPSAEQVAQLNEWRKELESKYGRAYRGQYGWASDLLGHEPTFAKLEQAAELEHWRPYYRLASHGVHANPKGAMWNLGYGRLTDLLLAGASNAGLADPGHQALLSLQITTASLLIHNPNAERLLVIKAMSNMVDRAGEAFLKAQQQLEREIGEDKPP